MQHLYRFELVKERYRGPTNRVLEGRDPSNDSTVTVCEWTPISGEMTSRAGALAECSGSVQAELFSTENAFYLVAPGDAEAAAALTGLQARGLFAGEWPGLLVPAVADSGKPRVEPHAEAHHPPRRRRSIWPAVLAWIALAMLAGLLALMLADKALGPRTSGAGPAPTPVPGLPNPKEAPVAIPRTAPANSTEAAVRMVLEHWRAAVVTGDADAQTDAYAPVVEVFFGRRNLKRSQLRTLKHDEAAKWPHTDRFDLSDIAYQMKENGHPSLTFRKHWERWDEDRKKRSIVDRRERLTFAQFHGEWKIVREEALVESKGKS